MVAEQGTLIGIPQCISLGNCYAVCCMLYAVRYHAIMLSLTQSMIA